MPKKINKKNLKSEQISPVFDEGCIPIVLSSSDFYTPYLAVCIKSIIETSSNINNYDILVMESSISESNKDRILMMAGNHPNVSVRFIEVYQKTKNINFYVNGKRISQETYYGLILPWFLTGYEKAIIMDCDMIVKKDIAELYYEDISNYLGAGVKDVVLQGFLNDKKADYYKYYTKKLGVKNPYNCFNGGLILLNIEKFKDAYTIEHIYDLLQNHKFRVVDQDIFNILLQNKTKILDARWNHMIFIKGYVEKSISIAPVEAKKIFFEAQKNPYIIHYVGDIKPWDDPSIEFADDFWTVARKTPFYEEIIGRMTRKDASDFAFHLIKSGNIVYYMPLHLAFIKSIKKIIDKLVTPLFPKESKSRDFVSKIYRKILKILSIRR